MKACRRAKTHSDGDRTPTTTKRPGTALPVGGSVSASRGRRRLPTATPVGTGGIASSATRPSPSPRFAEHTDKLRAATQYAARASIVTGREPPAPLVSFIRLLGTCWGLAPGASSLPLTLRSGLAERNGRRRRSGACCRCRKQLVRRRPGPRSADGGARPPGPASLQLAAHQRRARLLSAPWRTFTFAVSAWPGRASFRCARRTVRPDRARGFALALGSRRRRHAPALVCPTLGFSCEGPTFTSTSAPPSRQESMPQHQAPSTAASPCWAAAASGSGRSSQEGDVVAGISKWR